MKCRHRRSYVCRTARSGQLRRGRDWCMWMHVVLKRGVRKHGLQRVRCAWVHHHGRRGRANPVPHMMCDVVDALHAWSRRRHETRR